MQDDLASKNETARLQAPVFAGVGVANLIDQVGQLKLRAREYADRYFGADYADEPRTSVIQECPLFRQAGLLTVKIASLPQLEIACNDLTTGGHIEMIKQAWRRVRIWAVANTPPESYVESEKARDRISAELWGVGVGALVAGYFAADFLEFISPTTKLAIGLFAAILIWMLHAGLAAKANWKRATILLSVVAVLLAAMFTLDFVDTAAKESKAADERCADIQREMMKFRPTRSDLPSVFSALKCGPSGTDDIELSPPPRPPAAHHHVKSK